MNLTLKKQAIKFDLLLEVPRNFIFKNIFYNIKNFLIVHVLCHWIAPTPFQEGSTT